MSAPGGGLPPGALFVHLSQIPAVSRHGDAVAVHRVIPPVDEGENGRPAQSPAAAQHIGSGEERLILPAPEGRGLPVEGGELLQELREFLVFPAPGEGPPVPGIRPAGHPRLVPVVDAGDAGKAQGVQIISAKGKPYDAMTQEVVTTIPCAPKDDVLVLEEISSGVKMGDRVIRPAQVVVGKAPEADPKAVKQDIQQNKHKEK